jgi:hypothetical protein
MLDPQFLAQIRSYLNENGNRALDSGIGSLLGPGTAPTAAPTAPKPDALTSGIQSGMGSVVGYSANKAKEKEKEEEKKKQEWMPIPMQALMPPAGYVPGRSGEFNYGIGNPQTATAIRAYNESLNNPQAASMRQSQGNRSNLSPLMQALAGVVGKLPGSDIALMKAMVAGKFDGLSLPKKADGMKSGGTVSTGNPVADARIAAGDQRVIRNQEAAATYAAQDNARDGTPIPAHLQQRLNARSSSGSSDNNRHADDRAANRKGLFGGIGNLMSGQIAGFKNFGDMFDGGGRYGTRDNPGPRQGGLRAMARDVERGGIGALLRDSFDGGGYGASGDKFVGGPRALAANLLGIKPLGDDRDFFGIKANDYNAGTAGTKATGMAEGGMTPDGYQGGNEKDLISQAISAIRGQVEDPRPILAAFVQKYGEDALRNLVDKVEGGDVTATAEASQGQLRGPGDGMSDMIPASVDGENDVLLSDGEYVVPADVVSGLGNGSSDAGSKHLDEMMARVREQRTGSREQAKQINPKQAMPA